MPVDNPYEQPKTSNDSRSDGAKPLILSVVVVFGSSLLGGVMGLGIGLGLGSAIPNYYRSIFSNGNDPNFDPVAVGIGLGLSQGVAFGGLVGILLVALYYWNRSRSARSSSEH